MIEECKVSGKVVEANGAGLEDVNSQNQAADVELVIGGVPQPRELQVATGTVPIGPAAEDDPISGSVHTVVGERADKVIFKNKHVKLEGTATGTNKDDIVEVGLRNKLHLAPASEVIAAHVPDDQLIECEQGCVSCSPDKSVIGTPSGVVRGAVMMAASALLDQKSATKRSKGDQQRRDPSVESLEVTLKVGGVDTEVEHVIEDDGIVLGVTSAPAVDPVTGCLACAEIPDIPNITEITMARRLPPVAAAPDDSESAELIVSARDLHKCPSPIVGVEAKPSTARGVNLDDLQVNPGEVLSQPEARTIILDTSPSISFEADIEKESEERSEAARDRVEPGAGDCNDIDTIKDGNREDQARPRVMLQRSESRWVCHSMSHGLRSSSRTHFFS